jgi:hypothetical protein
MVPFPNVGAPKGLLFTAQEFTTACRLVCSGLFNSDNDNFKRLLYVQAHNAASQQPPPPQDTSGRQRTS